MTQKGELSRRIPTGLGIGALVIGAIAAGSLAASLLIVLITIACMYEYYRLLPGEGSASRRLVRPVLIPLPLIFLALQPVLAGTFSGFSAAHGGMLILLWVGLLSGIEFIAGQGKSVRDTGTLLNAMAFAAVMFLLPGYFGLYIVQKSPMLLLGIFILIWSSDIFAYFGGRRLGRHKIAPAISPGKSWEGLAFGFAAALVAAWMLSMRIAAAGLAEWLIIASLVVVFGTTGDLIQSTVKRTAGVKDSGDILPGHGGIWDRFDSLLGCLPWVGGYLWFIEIL